MEFPGKKVASCMQSLLKKEVQGLKKKKKKLTLVTLFIGNSPDQVSFIKRKALIAKRLGIRFKLINLKTLPSFESFLNIIKEHSNKPENTGIIIQQPLPAQFSTASVYDYIPNNKEIEGHKKKTPFIPPIGLTIMSIFKFLYGKASFNKNIFFDPKKDRPLIKNLFRSKKVVLIGRGITGGQLIGKTLTDYKINYFSINSQTPNQELYIKTADIVISAVGKKIITPEMLKPGVVLINVGLHKEKGLLKGDYDENEIKNLASFYTPTPGGTGPIDVLYLYKNLIDAAKMQK